MAFLNKILFYGLLISSTTAVAKGLGQLAPAETNSADAPDDDKDASSQQNSAPVGAPMGTDKTTPNPVALPGAGGVSTTPSVVQARSAMSQRLDGRLSMGTSLGFSYVKPGSGTWSGPGTTSIFMQWKNSAKAEERLFITGRYTPHAGTWKVDDRYYDATMHAFFLGASWLLPFNIGSAALKAGMELGYMMVYAKPQDRGEADAKVKAGKAAAGISTEMTWLVLDKLRVGPYLQVDGGGITVAHLGAGASFLF